MGLFARLGQSIPRGPLPLWGCVGPNLPNNPAEEVFKFVHTFYADLGSTVGSCGQGFKPGGKRLDTPEKKTKLVFRGRSNTSLPQKHNAPEEGIWLYMMLANS